MSRTKWISFVLLASLVATVARAQDDDVTVVRSITVSVKPGMNVAFEEFVRALRDASREQSRDNYWFASQSISGLPVYRFNSSLSGWTDLLDPGPELAEFYGEQEAQRLFGLIRDSVESTHTAFFNQRTSMSHPPTNMSRPPEAIVYIDFTLNPGGAAAYRELATKTAEASAAVLPNAYFVAAMPGFGAEGPRTTLIVPSFGDMNSPQPGPAQRVLQHFGQQEGARINALAADAISSFEATLFRTRPDLSYRPAE